MKFYQATDGEHSGGYFVHQENAQKLVDESNEFIKSHQHKSNFRHVKMDEWTLKEIETED